MFYPEEAPPRSLPTWAPSCRVLAPICRVVSYRAAYSKNQRFWHRWALSLGKSGCHCHPASGRFMLSACGQKNAKIKAFISLKDYRHWHSVRETKRGGWFMKIHYFTNILKNYNATLSSSLLLRVVSAWSLRKDEEKNTIIDKTKTIPLFLVLVLLTW